MGDYARRKNSGDDDEASVGAPGMDAFWAGVAKGATASLVDPRVPGKAPDPTAMLPYIDRDHDDDPVAMATKVTAQLTQSTARARAFTQAKAQPFVDALVAGMALTDEREGRFQILNTLDRLDDPSLRDAVLAAFHARTGRTLSAAIATAAWYGTRDAAQAQALISPERAKTEREIAAMSPEKRAKLKAEARTTATAIADVVGRGAARDDDRAHKIQRALAGKTPAQIEAIRAAVREQTRGNESLYEQLDRSMSGSHEDETVASLTGDPIYAASVALQNAAGDAPRLREILQALEPAQLAALKQRYPAAAFTWMTVAPDQQAELGALVNGDKTAATGAKVADLLRDPLHGAQIEGTQLDEQSTRNFDARSTDNVLRELAKMPPDEIAAARRTWNASALKRGDKTWDAMIEERFASGDPLVFARIRALTTGNKVEATALALQQGTRDHDQTLIDDALANPDLSSPDPDKRAAAREHARAVAARFQDLGAAKAQAIAAMQGGDLASARGDSLDTALANHTAYLATTQKIHTTSQAVATVLSPEEQARKRKKLARAAEVGTDELRGHGSFSTATEIRRARATGDEGRVAEILEAQPDKTAVHNIDSEYFTKYGEELFHQPDSEKVAAYRNYKSLYGETLTHEQAAYNTRDTHDNRVQAVKDIGPRAARTNEQQAELDRREHAHHKSDELGFVELVHTSAFGHAAGTTRRVDWALANEADAVAGSREELEQHAAHTRAMSNAHREEKIAMGERAARFLMIAGKLAALATLNPAAMAVIDALVGVATVLVREEIEGESYKTAAADLLDTAITVATDLGMLPTAKIESALIRATAVIGLTSSAIVVTNTVADRDEATALDLLKNLILTLVFSKGGDKLEDALGGGALGKGVNIATNTLAGGAINGSEGGLDLLTEGLDNADGMAAKRPHARHRHHADGDQHPHADSDQHPHADSDHRLSREDYDDATKLGELRRRRANAAPADEPDVELDAHIEALETKLRLRDDAPDHAARRRAIEQHLAPHKEYIDSRYQTRAELVPGSEFRGRGTGDSAEVHATAMGLVEEIVRRYPDVADVKRVDASEARKPDKRARLAATFLVTLKPVGTEAPAPFTIRIAVGPHEGQTVARTIVNPSQEGRHRVPGSEAINVRGRYVIQLSDQLDPSHVERALAHEVAELRAARTLHDEGRYAGVDALRAGSLGDVLSPHDLGRIAELDVLARGMDPAQQSPARTEILALIEHMGLRASEPGADGRLDLAKQHMAPATAHVIDALRKPHDQLPDDVASDVHAIRERAEHDHATERAREASRTPMHDPPTTLDEFGHPMSRYALAARAEQAAAARQAKSDETWDHLASLAAASPNEPPLLPFEVQIGAGASMAARDRNHLVIDDRGRWQADGNHDIAQTATQSRGTKDAGFGDATQVAKPDRRVPRDAIAYWEDNIAAQGPVVNGRAALRIGPNGHLLLTITKDGHELTFRVSSTPYVATGFPPEKITGSTYGKSIRETAVVAQEALAKIADTHPDENVRTSAEEAIARMKSTRLTTNEDAMQFGAILGDPRLREAIASNSDLSDAIRVSEAAEHWARVTGADDPHHRHVLLGDQANIGREHALRSHNWLVAGTGGTAVSAAEIVLGENTKAHVTMYGADEPDGLMENDQFLAMAKEYADPELAARLGIPPGTGRLSVAEPQYVGQLGVSENDNSAHGLAWVDESDIDSSRRSKHVYDINGTSSNARGTAYIAAIGRENDYPPVVAGLLDQARREGLEYAVTPLFHDRQYVGYTVTITPLTGKPISVDITGAASRFLPNADRENWSADDTRLYEQSADWDAPAESGGFAGGLQASAVQADRYAQKRRETSSRNELERGTQ